jgi:hypothetical protein
MSEPLDDLLDRSAPLLADRGSGRDDALSLMVRDARDTERPQKRTRRRIALLSGALALVLVGGAGVATATSDWLWGQGLENPDRSYTYTSPTWGQCEIRYSGFDTHNPLTQADVNRVIDEWFANTDVEAAADPYVAKYLEQIEADQKAAADPITDPRLADLNAWQAHDQALATALHDELKAHGYDSGAGDLAGTDGHSQLHCEGEDWGGEGSE